VPFAAGNFSVVDGGDACRPLGAKARKAVPRDALFVARRGGGCDFLAKAKNAQESGAAAVLVANEDASQPLLRAGCHPRWAGADVRVPVGLAAAAAGDALVAAAADGAGAALAPGDGGHAAAWESLATLGRDSAWPRSRAARLRKFDQLKAALDFEAVPERGAWLSALKGLTDALRPPAAGDEL